MDTEAGDRKDGINWGLIHQRLDASRVALERALSPSPDYTRQVLRSRARSLAREPEVAGTSAQTRTVVEFSVTHDRYLIESQYIREILPPRGLQPLPGTPRFVLGLIHIRGQILSVIDLKKFFDLPEKGLSNLDKVIVLRAGNMELGIVADEILAVRQVALEAIQPCLPTLTGIRADFVKGVTPDLSVLLNVEKLLSDERIIVDED